jgi:CheY-like chemotaxis protein
MSGLTTGTASVLVVEDNAEIAAVFVGALQAEGYRVETCASGTAALERLAGCDIALMDLSLPDLNGVEVAVRARAMGCRVPMIAVSGAMPLIEPSRLAEAGFVATIGKPARLSALLDLVKQHLPVTARQ